MLTDLHTAIITRLRNAFPALPSCETYPLLSRKIAIPAVFVELSELPPADEDPGTGQLALSARFTAWIVCDLTMPEAQTGAANLAASVALEVYQAARFGQSVGAAKVLRIAADEFKPELAGYVVWAVEWSHDIRLGESVWDGEGVMPTEVWVGQEVAG